MKEKDYEQLEHLLRPSAGIVNIHIRSALKKAIKLLRSRGENRPLEPPISRIFTDIVALQGNIKVKIKGDNGTYKLCGVDWFHYRYLIDRACGLEWVDYKRCKPAKSMEKK